MLHCCLLFVVVCCYYDTSFQRWAGRRVPGHGLLCESVVAKGLSSVLTFPSFVSLLAFSSQCFCPLIFDLATFSFLHVQSVTFHSPGFCLSGLHRSQCPKLHFRVHPARASAPHPASSANAAFVHRLGTAGAARSADPGERLRARTELAGSSGL